MLSRSQSIQLGKVFGIPILVHWTFSLFILFIVYTARQNNLSNSDGFWFLAFVFILFLFVILHELGHALAARKYGVKTRDIIISPIGGIARLEEIPPKPLQELIVAIAGPLVNVILALFFLLIIFLFSKDIIPDSQKFNLIEAPLDYIRYLFIINVTLVVFNLIPAFPMDGGRVLRALLSLKFSRLKATYIASTIAKIISILFVLLGAYHSHIILMLIGAFVLFTSGAEYSNALLERVFKESKASHAALTNPIFLNSHQTFNEVLILNSRKQSNYLVKNDLGNIVGVVAQPLLNHAKKEKLLSQPIKNFMSSHHGAVSENLGLDALFSLMNKNAWYVVDIISTDMESTGIVDRTSLNSFIQARKKELKS